MIVNKTTEYNRFSELFKKLKRPVSLNVKTEEKGLGSDPMPVS